MHRLSKSRILMRSSSFFMQDRFSKSKRLQEIGQSDHTSLKREAKSQAATTSGGTTNCNNTSIANNLTTSVCIRLNMSSAQSSRDNDDILRMDERHHREDRRRSRSRSRSKRHRDEIERRSRSRSRSADRYRRRRSRRTRSRSGSRSHGYSSHRKSSRRYGDSRSRSRSRSSHRSHKQSRSSRHSTSRSPKTSYERYESKESPSHSVEDEKTSIIQSNSESRKSLEEDNNSSQNLSCTADMDTLENLPLPEQAETTSNIYIDDSQEPIDKERIHREMEEKLRQALAKEGKIYPPPKPEASHPVFANDGSFLAIFKKMQEAQQTMTATTTTVPAFGITAPSTSTAAAAYTAPCALTQPTPPPLVGRRRGGKILKTGVVAKPKVNNNAGDDKDFWSLYLAEVNKYKNNACELNSGNRPLLK